MPALIQVKRALISVSDKTDLVPFARRLVEHGTRIISTGGTARVLEQAGIEVIRVDQITGFPEMMDGRVKTLHPKIHGALLALRDTPDHTAALAEHDIDQIDLVCVNLYPFELTIAKPDVGKAEAIEQIDIGGPSMIRSAAKNHQYVAVLTDPSQYDRLISEMDANHAATTLDLRQWLATTAFERTAAYDRAIVSWLSGQYEAKPANQLPTSLTLRYQRQTTLRYGENPHQAGALYVDPDGCQSSVAQAKQVHGKPLSFCNLYDANGALELVKEIDANDLAAVAVIKHANPCGFAVDQQLDLAFDKAYAGDPLAAFGGIVACNRPVESRAAQRMVSADHFLEVIVAPSYDDDALAILQERWKNTRLLAVGPPDIAAAGCDFKSITGGLLVHQRDQVPFDPSQWNHVAGPQPKETDLRQMTIAMIAVKHLKSNAVCLVNDNMLVGAGAGQMDRLASCRIAIDKAGDRAQGAVAASDAFFPFRDGPDQLITAGVRGIVEPGGSKRDDQTIQACNDAGVTLVFTGRRHFRH